MTLDNMEGIIDQAPLLGLNRLFFSVKLVRLHCVMAMISFTA
jgi:hypothetical protein